MAAAIVNSRPRLNYHVIVGHPISLKILGAMFNAETTVTKIIIITTNIGHILPTITAVHGRVNDGSVGHGSKVKRVTKF